MQNHLFIGLGGQGGRTLGELRKVMAQRSKDTSALTEHNVKIEFLAIDSSDDVRNDRRSWTDFGTDQSLDPSDWLILSRPGPDSLGSLALRPDIAPWIGDRKRVESFLGQGQIQGANQRRRFGRLLFSFNSTEIRTAINRKVDKLTTGNQNQCAFHIFATLAGGTGSGGIIDLITMIRSRFAGSDITEFPVFVYVYATDSDEKGANVGYFFQNQFTSLRDLNALMCGRLHPPLIGDSISPQIFTGVEPIAQLTLTAPLNSENRQIQLETQIRIIAEACFERIVAWTCGQMSVDAQRSLTGQDIIATFAGEPISGNPERSYRFSALGMRRWEVPHAKLEKLLALDLLICSLKQMLFNHWHESKGFLHQLDNSTEAAVSNNLPTLLSEIEESRHSSPSVDVLLQHLRDGLHQVATGLKRETDQSISTLRHIEMELLSFYKDRFEQSGIDHLIKQRQIELPSAVKEATRRVEYKLTQLWLDRTNPLALTRIHQVLEELIHRLRQEPGNSTSNDATAQRRQDISRARAVEWDKLTYLSSKLTSKRRQLIDAHTSDCTHNHEFDLRNRLAQLDRDFVKAFLGRVTNVITQFRSVQQIFQRLLDNVQNERNLIDRELRNLHHDVSANKYEFDPEALDNFLTWMRSHQSHMENSAYAMRDEIIKIIGTSQPLSVLGEDISGTVDERLMTVAIQQARYIHQDYGVTGSGQSILEDSVLDILENRHRENRANFVKELGDFLGQAAVCLNIRKDTQPRQLIDVGVGVPSMPKRILLIGLPRHSFAQTLKKEFHNVLSAGKSQNPDIFEHDDPGQIRLLTVDYWFAARFSSIVKSLADRYQISASGTHSTDTSYFCNIDEDDETSRRPDLFLPSEEEMRLRYEAEIWLGQQKGIETIIVNDKGVYVVLEDKDGRHSDRLGGNLNETLANPDYAKMFKLHGRLGTVISAVYERKKFIEMLNEKRLQLEKEHGLASDEYRRWDRKLKLLKSLVE